MRNLTIIWLFFTCLLSQPFGLMAQDFHFTQFYAAPLNLSPAFAGAMETTRLGINYRLQWPGLGYDFHASGFYFDSYIDETNVGYGFSISRFSETVLKINSTDLSGYFSYMLPLNNNPENKSTIRFGGQFGIVNRSLTLQELVFGDQIDVLNQTVNPTSADLLPGEDNTWYPDISFGALLQTPDFWFGVSSSHVTRPNIGFLDDGIGNNLPIKWGIHGGYFKFLNSKRDIYKAFNVAFNYKRQGTFQQIEVIPQVQVENFIGGLGFRNITRFNELPDQNSINAVLGFSLLNGITGAYSYDYMLSRFSSPAHVSHEVSIYFTDLKMKKNRAKRLHCYTY